MGTCIRRFVVSVVILGWLVARLVAQGTQEPSISPQSPSTSGAPASSGQSTDLFTGRMSYAIPLRVAPARGGSEPSLSLVYSSGGDNGWCGVGWGIPVGCIERDGREGVPITRTPTGYASSYDDAAGFVSTVGGGPTHLVVAESADVFRPEVDTSSFRFTRDVAANRWTAVDPSGRRYEFGAVASTTDALLRNPKPGWGNGWNATYRWCLKKVVDTDGNETWYDYAFDQDLAAASPFRQQYLETIRYNGSSVGPLAPTHSVTFLLEEDAPGVAATRPDVFTSLRAGFKVLTRRRLAAVEARVGTQLVRRYELGYVVSGSTGKSLLDRVTEIGSDGVSALPSLDFGYTSMSMSFAPKVAWGGLHNQGQPNDPDWNATQSYGHGSACGSQGLWLRDLRDMDKDGYPDLVMLPCGETFDHLNVQYNNGSGFEPTVRPIPIYTPNTSEKRWASPRFDDTSSSGDSVLNKLLRIDFDGDAYEDLLWRVDGSTGNEFHVRLSRRGIEFPDEYSGFFTIDVPYTSQGSSSGFWNSPESTQNTDDDDAFPDLDTSAGLASFRDMNGDGRPDFVQRKASGSDYSVWKVQLNTGTGLEPVRDWDVASQGTTNARWNSLMHHFNDLPDGGDESEFHFGSGGDIPNTTSWTVIESLSFYGYGIVANVHYSDIFFSHGNSIQFRLKHNGITADVWSSMDDFNGADVHGTWTLEARDMSPLTTELADLASWHLDVDFLEHERGDGSLLVDIADMNGDGLPDRVSAELNGNSAPGLTSAFDAFAVELNNGAGFEPVEYWPIQSQGATQRWWTSPGGERNYDLDDDDDEDVVTAVLSELTDVNGDGLPDKVQRRTSAPYDRFVVQINTGNGFAPEEDFTGVEFPDNPGSLSWFWGAPTGRRGFETHRTTHMLVDMTGDGLPDRVMESNASPYDRLYVQASQGKVPDLLRRIDNGTGGRTTVVYTPSSHFDNRETLGTPNPWSSGTSGEKNLLPGLRQLVTEIKVDDGLGQVLSTTYDYAGGHWDTKRREFRGFYKVTQVDPDLSQTITWFHQGGGPLGEQVPSGGSLVTPASLGEYQDVEIFPTIQGTFAKAGFPFRVEVWGHEADGTDKLYQRNYQQIAADKIVTGRYFPYLLAKASYEYEGLPDTYSYGGYHRAVMRRFVYAPTPDGQTKRLVRDENWGRIVPNYFDPLTYAFGESGYTNDDTSTVTTYADATETGSPDILDRVKDRAFHGSPMGTGTPLRLTRHFYEAGNGRLVAVANAKDVANDQWVTESYGYDAYGNQETRTDPVGVVSRTVYDTTYHSLPVQKIADDTGCHRVTSLTVDPRSGQTLESVDPNGVVTIKRFDAHFRPYETAVDDGTGEVWLDRMEYHLDGIVAGESHNCSVQHTNQGSTTDTDGIATCEYQDGLGRSIQSRAETEDVADRYRVTDTAFDARGNPSLRTQIYFGYGSAYAAPPPGQPATLTEFDALSRAERVLPPAGEAGALQGESTIGYRDGYQLWTTVSVDAELRTRKTRGDAYGRTVSVVDGGGHTTQYVWSLAGDLQKVIDAQGNQTTLAYDSLGRKVSIDDPDLGFWTYAYDDADRPVEQVDALGNRIVNHYDSLGRVRLKEVFDPLAQLESSVVWDYDTPVDPGHAVYLGQLARIVDAEGETLFGYDVRGRLLKRTRRLAIDPGRDFTFEYTYDDVGHVRTIVYPGAVLKLEQIFDEAGNLRTVRRLPGSGTALTFYQAAGVNEAGQVVSFSYGNGVATTLDYYPTTKRLHRLTASGAAGLVLDLEYDYDKIGNIKNVVDHRYTSAPESASLSGIQYDGLDRLLGYTRGGSLPGTTETVSFSYDPIGNIVLNGDLGGTAATTPYEYTSPLGQPHAVTSADGLAFTYDANGNMTHRGGELLSYDAQNRLAGIITAGGRVLYGYDGDGKRLWKDVDNGTITKWIEGIYEERGGTRLCHVMAGGRRVCVVNLGPVPAAGGGGTGPYVKVPVPITPQYHYHHADQLKSASVVTNSQGSTIQHWVFRAFGETHHEDTGNVFGPGYLFTDHVFDEETGLYDFGARYYEPRIGRFIQADPVVPTAGNSQALNRYAYAENNPLRYNDASGHAPQENHEQYFVTPWSPAARGWLRTYAPVDLVTGRPLTRIDLFSGRAFAKNADWLSTHQTLQNTIYHQRALALDNVPGSFNRMAWAEQSEIFAFRAGIGQVPTQSNFDALMSRPRGETIQWAYERPALAKGGSIVAGLGVVSGGLQLLTADQYRPGLREAAYVGGAAETAGGVAYATGSFLASADVMLAGATLMEAGSGVGLAVVVVDTEINLALAFGELVNKAYEPIYEELDRINSFGRPEPQGTLDPLIWATPPWEEPTNWEKFMRGYPLEEIDGPPWLDAPY